MPTVTAVRRHSSPDLFSSVINQSKIRSQLSEAMNTVTNVEEKPSKSVTKSDILNFRHDYRKNAAITLSNRNEDFKLAYQNGNVSQKRELENIAMTLHIVEKNFDNTENGSVKKEELNALIDKLFLAIKKGNEKPDSHFTNEQNHNVNKENKEQKNYQKTVNEIGKFVLKEFSTPRSASKLVMPDVIRKCNDVLSQFDLNVSSVPDYLEQSAVNAERNMRTAVVSDGSSNMQGIDFLKQVTIHTNSLLNLPNYLRDFGSKKENADNNPAPESFSPAQDNKSYPYSSPAINNVFSPNVNANPIININLGDKLDRLLDVVEKLVTQGSKDIHQRNVYEPIELCKQIKGSDKLPHRAVDGMHLSTFTIPETIHSERVETFLQPSLSQIITLRNDRTEDNGSKLVNIYEEKNVVQAFGQENHVATTTPPYDNTFIAKEARAGKGVILSQNGFRPNIMEADNAAYRRQNIYNFTASSNAISGNQVEQNNTTYTRSRSIGINDKINVNRNDVEQDDAILSHGRLHKKISLEFSPELISKKINGIDSNESENSIPPMNSSLGTDNKVSDDTLADKGDTEKLEELSDNMTAKTERKQFYSPYLDESGKRRNPMVTLTTDGLHMPRR